MTSPAHVGEHKGVVTGRRKLETGNEKGSKSISPSPDGPDSPFSPTLSHAVEKRGAKIGTGARSFSPEKGGKGGAGPYLSK